MKKYMMKERMKRITSILLITVMLLSMTVNIMPLLVFAEGAGGSQGTTSAAPMDDLSTTHPASEGWVSASDASGLSKCLEDGGKVYLTTNISITTGSAFLSELTKNLELDGCGYTITFVPSGTTAATSPWCLIGSTNAAVTSLKVKNLNLAGTIYSGATYVGSLIGAPGVASTSVSEFENVHSSVDIIYKGNNGKLQAAGGLVGYTQGKANFNNVSYTGDLNTGTATIPTSNSWLRGVGGIIGCTASGTGGPVTVQDATVISKITVGNKDVYDIGGVIGTTKKQATLTGITANVNINVTSVTPTESGKTNKIGGIIGRAHNAGPVALSSIAATVNISNTAKVANCVGGVIGQVDGVTTTLTLAVLNGSVSVFGCTKAEVVQNLVGSGTVTQSNVTNNIKVNTFTSSGSAGTVIPGTTTAPTGDDWQKVETLAQLKDAFETKSKAYLAADVVLSGTDAAVINWPSAAVTLDGCGHSIIFTGGATRTIFNTSYAITVKNLNLTGTINVPSSATGHYVGPLAPEVVGLTLENVHSSVDITYNGPNSTLGAAGGIVGYAKGVVNLTNVSYTGHLNTGTATTLTTQSYLRGVGGIIGCTAAADGGQATINNVTVVATITVGNKDMYDIGGVFGTIKNSTSIQNLTADVTVNVNDVGTTKKRIGGIVGRIHSNALRTVTIDGVTGAVTVNNTATAENSVGGIVGGIEKNVSTVTITNSTFEGTVNVFNGSKTTKVKRDVGDVTGDSGTAPSITVTNNITTHRFNTAWVQKNDIHYHECLDTDCTVKGAQSFCSGGQATCTEQATCDVCGNPYGPEAGAGHSWSNTLTQGDTTHYYACSNCDDRKDETAHTYTYAVVDGIIVGTCGCGKTANVGSQGTTAATPTTGETDGWTAVGDEESLKKALVAGGNIYLTADITISTAKGGYLTGVTKAVVLDGRGHTITFAPTGETAATSPYGLISTASAAVTFKNLNLAGTIYSGAGNVGPLVGAASAVTLENVHSSVDVIYVGSAIKTAGGLVGQATGTIDFDNVSYTGDIDTGSYAANTDEDWFLSVGGIVGCTPTSSTISLDNVIVISNITVGNDKINDIGGVIGTTKTTTNITGATVDVTINTTGTANSAKTVRGVGGIIGRTFSAGSVVQVVLDNLSVAVTVNSTVSAADYVGGVVGWTVSGRSALTVKNAALSGTVNVFNGSLTTNVGAISGGGGATVTATENVINGITTHRFATDWSWADNSHYHVCLDENCDVKGGAEACSGGQATCTEQAICDVCGNPYGPEAGAGHSWSNTLTQGDTTHYYACSNCDDRKDETAHTYTYDVVDGRVVGTCECTKTVGVGSQGTTAATPEADDLSETHPSDTWQAVSTLEQLQNAFSSKSNAYLTTNITVSGLEEKLVINTWLAKDVVLDGCGYTVTFTGDKTISLINGGTKNVTVKNLNLAGTITAADDHAGHLAPLIYNGTTAMLTLENVHSKVAINGNIAKLNAVGGIVAKTDGGLTLNNVSYEGTINTGTEAANTTNSYLCSVGGIIGSTATSSTITATDITVKAEMVVGNANMNYIGGIVGACKTATAMTNVTVDVDITVTGAGVKALGGLIGRSILLDGLETAVAITFNRVDATVDITYTAPGKSTASKVNGVVGAVVANNKANKPTITVNDSELDGTVIVLSGDSTVASNVGEATVTESVINNMVVHRFSADWTSDGENHYHACLETGCTEKRDVTLCSGGQATCTDQATCTVCGNKYGSTGGSGTGEHDYDLTTWSYNDTHHYHKCKYCTAFIDEVPHTYTYAVVDGRVVGTCECTKTVGAGSLGTTAATPTTGETDGWTAVGTEATLQSALAAGGNIYLTADITISTTKGGYLTNGTKAVVLDGRGHTITFAPTGETADTSPYGLISTASAAVTFKNLNLEGTIYSGAGSVGPLVAEASAVTLENVHSSVDVIYVGSAIKLKAVGGLIGQASGSLDFDNVSYTGDINTGSSAADTANASWLLAIGGIIGVTPNNNSATTVDMRDITVASTITVNNAGINDIGGIVGTTKTETSITNATVNLTVNSTGKAKDTRAIGGVVGRTYSAKETPAVRLENLGITVDINHAAQDASRVGGVVGNALASNSIVTVLIADVEGEIEVSNADSVSVDDIATGTATAEDRIASNLTIHRFTSAWTQVGETHYHACLETGCTEKRDEGACTGGTPTCTEPASCKDCGNPYGDSLGYDEHTYADWDHDADAHWGVCSRCQAPSERLPHNYIYESVGGQITGSCECGATVEVGSQGTTEAAPDGTAAPSGWKAVGTLAELTTAFNSSSKAYLTADIELTGTGAGVFGWLGKDVVLDGRGHTITFTGGATRTLIGSCAGSITIKNLNLAGNILVPDTVEGHIAPITSNGATGTLTLENVHSKVNITLEGAKPKAVGGLVGKTDSDVIMNNVSYSGTINTGIGDASEAESWFCSVGGIIGSAPTGGSTTITNASVVEATFTVGNAEMNNIGGIIGVSKETTNIIGATVDVTINVTGAGSKNIGGVIGYATADDNVTEEVVGSIRNVEANVTIDVIAQNASDIGGIVGSTAAGKANLSVKNVELDGAITVDDRTGLSTAEDVVGGGAVLDIENVESIIDIDMSTTYYKLLVKVNQAVAQADTYVATDYTDGCADWTTFAQALTATKEARDSSAEYNVLKGAYDSLVDAMSNLADDRKAPVFTELYEAFGDIDGLYEIDYTEATWADLMEAKANAQAVDNAESKQSEVDAAVEAIRGAIAGLEQKAANLGELEASIERADALSASDYTNWPETELAAAKALSTASKQSEVNAAKAALDAKLDALIATKTFKYSLYGAIQRAEALVQTDYTAGWDNLLAKISAAQTVYNNDTALASEVNAAEAAIDAAIEALTKADTATDKQALLDAIAEARNNTTATYCKAGVDALNAVIARIEGEYEAKTLKSEIAALTAELEAAVEAVVEHKGSDTWVSDGAHHWHFCVDCQMAYGESVHVFGEAASGHVTCTECGISYILGDLDGSGQFNSDDVIYLSRYVSAIDKSLYPLSQNCDYTKDGRITMDDVTYMMRSLFNSTNYPLG